LLIAYFYKCRCLNTGIGCTPFEAMFGIKCRNDLESLALPADVLNSVENEEQLEALLGKNLSSELTTFTSYRET